MSDDTLNISSIFFARPKIYLGAHREHSQQFFLQMDQAEWWKKHFQSTTENDELAVELQHAQRIATGNLHCEDSTEASQDLHAHAEFLGNLTPAQFAVGQRKRGKRRLCGSLAAEGSGG